MQQHWHEPQPLGDAQRVGMMQVQQQQQQQGQHEAMIRRQIAAQHAQGMQRARPQGIVHSVGSFLTGGAGGILLGALGGIALGWYLGSNRERSVLTKRLGEKALVAGNPDDDDDDYDDSVSFSESCAYCAARPTAENEQGEEVCSDHVESGHTGDDGCAICYGDCVEA
jgi:hypothetical protein